LKSQKLGIVALWRIAFGG